MATRTDRFGSGLPVTWDTPSALPEARAEAASRRGRRLPLHLLAGGLLVALVVFAAVFAPHLTRYAPDVINPAFSLQPPSADHPFGTDAFGRDLFSRIVFGARLALKLSLLAALISAVPGILLGLLAGFYRGWVDHLLSRFVDAWLALPGLLMALVIIARTGPSLEGAILALGLTGIPGYFRLVRSSTISVGRLPYIEASRALGASGPRLIFSHILPNLVSSIVILTTLRLGTFLLAGGSLSFIGLGAQPPQPEWGALLSEGRDYLDIAWWMFFFPLMAITMAVMGYNLLGDGLRDYLARK